MKHNSSLLLLLFISLWTESSNGQAIGSTINGQVRDKVFKTGNNANLKINVAETCLSNGNFSSWDGKVDNGGCSVTFDAGSVTNWDRSHGTPEIHRSTASPAYNYMFMFDDYYNGEGIFASYHFVTGNHYIVSVTLYTTAASASETYIYAANNIVEGADRGCGDPIPSVSSKFLIGSISDNNQSGYTTYTLPDFIADGDYTQLWIYPHQLGVNKIASTKLYLNNVSVCPFDPCSGIVHYNNGTIDAGNSNAGYIYVGSTAGTGGSPTVSILPDQVTNLNAVNEIDLLPEFQAVITTGSFVANIVSCNTNASIEKQLIYNREGHLNDIIDGIGVNIDSSKNKAQAGTPESISVYPTPSTGIINISWNKVDHSKSQITVLDQAGNQVFKLQTRSTESNCNINLSNLANGLYFIQIKINSGMVVKKILINK